MDRQAVELRATVQEFLRRFGALDATRTPCGMPLALSQAHALMILLEKETTGGRSRLAELASDLGIDKSNATRLCQRMDAAGQITIKRCLDDGRAKRVALRAKGRRLAQRISQSSHDRFNSILDALPRSERRPVIEALETLNAALCNLNHSSV